MSRAISRPHYPLGRGARNYTEDIETERQRELFQDEEEKVLDVVTFCSMCPVSATLQDHGWRDVLPSLWSCLRFYPPDNLIVSESPDGNGAAAAMALTSNFHVIFTASVGFRRLCFYDLKQVSG